MKFSDKSRSKSSSRLRLLLKGTLIFLLICVAGVLALSFAIELSVKRTCEMAVREHPGDKVDALRMCVKSDKYGYDAHHYRMNNRVVWALGQLGDERALPFLRNLATDRPCDHETNLCQGEIQQAIRKLESNAFNLPRFLWHGVLKY